jgi:molybdopterin-binding protein
MDVRALRRRTGLTQTGLAELVGVHPITVSKWERGVLAPNRHQLALLRALAAPPGRAPEKGSHVVRLAQALNRAFIEVVEVENMKLSASNSLRGKVVELDIGTINSRVIIEIAPGVRVTSVITSASVKRLGLKVGRPATAIIKATDVIVGVR